MVNGVEKMLGTRMNQRFFVSIVFGTVVGVIVLGLILSWAGFQSVWEHMKVVKITYLLVYVALAIPTNLLRALRFRLLLGKGTLVKLYGIVSVHTFMINLLPFSTGEIAYPLLLKRYGLSERFMEGVPSIVIARFQDAFLNLGFVVLALAWTGDLRIVFQALRDHFAVGGLSLLALGAAGVFLYRRSNRVWLPVQYLRQFAVTVGEWLKSTKRTLWLSTFLIAFAIRFISVLGVFYLLQGVGIQLSFATVFLISSLYVFLPLLPLNTLMGIGITEGFLLAFFMHNGIDRSFATAASVQVHALQLVVAAILGAFGLMQLQYLKNRDFYNVKSVFQP